MYTREKNIIYKLAKVKYNWNGDEEFFICIF